MANEIGNIGNGNGYLYISDNAGTGILSVLPNNYTSGQVLLRSANGSGVIPREAYINAGDLQAHNDPNFGYRYWINADYGGAANPESLASAVEITHFIVNKGLQTNFASETHVISGGAVSVVDRRCVLYKLYVDTEGAAATDELDNIDGDFIEGDIIIIAGVDSGRVTTVRDSSVSGGNINLENNNSFVTGTTAKAITLQYQKPNLATAGVWNEVSRASSGNQTLNMYSCMFNLDVHGSGGAWAYTIDNETNIGSIFQTPTVVWGHSSGPAGGDTATFKFEDFVVGGGSLTDPVKVTCQILVGNTNLSISYNPNPWSGTKAIIADIYLTTVSYFKMRFVDPKISGNGAALSLDAMRGYRNASDLRIHVMLISS